MKKKFTINGKHFSNLDGFYDEAQKILTDNFKEFGRNLDAFNDILRGGFGKFKYGEKIILIWENFEKSEKNIKPEILEKLISIIEDSDNVEFKKF